MEIDKRSQSMGFGIITRRNYTMKLNNIIYFLCFFLIFQEASNSQSLQLRQVTQHFGDQGRLEWDRRYATNIGDEKHKIGGVFTAKKYEKWTLRLAADGVSLNPDNTTSVLPLNIPEQEILGENGLLLKSIEKFLEDVPDAVVDTVTIELRSSPALWDKYVSSVRAHFSEKKTTLDDVKAIDRELAVILAEVLNNSPEAKALGEKIAKKTGRSVYKIGVAAEVWEVSHIVKSGEKLSVIAEHPTLGFGQSPLINFHLK